MAVRSLVDVTAPHPGAYPFPRCPFYFAHASKFIPDTYLIPLEAGSV